jgi:hypothetical protein
MTVLALSTLSEGTQKFDDISCNTIRGDAYTDVGGRKRLEHVFEGAAPTIGFYLQ